MIAKLPKTNITAVNIITMLHKLGKKSYSINRICKFTTTESPKVQLEAIKKNAMENISFPGTTNIQVNIEQKHRQIAQLFLNHSQSKRI